MYTNYNVCKNTLFGASASGGSWFYDRYFFPRYGHLYPAYMDIGCGAGRFDSYASSYEQAVELSQNADVIARSELHYTIGTADFLYDGYLVSSETYRALGFTVSEDILPDVEHCAFDNSAKSAEFWRQKWGSVVGDSPVATAQIAVVSGNNQRVMNEEQFAEPLVVVVLDENSQPLADVAVEFRVVPPEGSPSYYHYADIHTPLVKTNAAGQAQTLVTAGDRTDEYQVTAKIVMLDRVVSFALDNISAYPDVVKNVSGSDQEAVVGQPYASPLVVQVFNDEGIPLPGLPVTFVVRPNESTGASVSLSTEMVVTDANGRASVTAQANESAGYVSLYAYTYRAPYYASSDSSFLLRNIDSPTSIPDAINIVSGDGQEAWTGQLYTLPLVVQVLNNEGIPLPGVPISFTVHPDEETGASVTLSAEMVVTDANGRASVTAQANQFAGFVFVDAYHTQFQAYMDSFFVLRNVASSDNPNPTQPFTEGIRIPFLRR